MIIFKNAVLYSVNFCSVVHECKRYNVMLLVQMQGMSMYVSFLFL